MKSMITNVTVYLIGTVISLLPLQARASQDCRQEAKEQVEDCTTIAKAAEQANSEVSSGLAGGSGNMNGGATDLAAVSQFGRSNLQKASAQCTKHLQECLKECNQALSQTQEPNLVTEIKQNAKYCHESISDRLARLETAEQQLAETAQASRKTASSSGDSRYRDQNIDKREDGFNQEDVHQVASPGSVKPGYAFKGPNGEYCSVVGAGAGGCRVSINGGAPVPMRWDQIPGK